MDSLRAGSMNRCGGQDWTRLCAPSGAGVLLAAHNRSASVRIARFLRSAAILLAEECIVLAARIHGRVRSSALRSVDDSLTGRSVVSLNLGSGVTRAKAPRNEEAVEDGIRDISKTF